MKEYKRVYERILEMDKRLDIAKKQLQVCEDRERKLQREMVKGSKAPGITQDKLQQAVDARNLASTELTSQKRETDALKLASVRAGLLELSQSWASLGRKCAVLAESQMELAQLIPDVNTRLEEIPPYTDAHESQKIIYSTRGKLEHLEPPKYSSAALATSFSSPSSSTSSLPPYEPPYRPMSAGYRGPRRMARLSDASVAVVPSLPTELEEEDSFDSFDSD
ncbi:hypothetical protein GBAR_LOCUS3319 [Geodia barretti]|uniref:Uncharacterized protein n=1 Tax=Geodia barretti TaxID=519541 RepID=A0AA35R2V3_GEOBA|nr:hypothetical protein GBAR_LOCUS3319 [Geodia barretti]